MNYPLLKLAAKTGSSVVVDSCQSCGSNKLEGHLFLGYMPPVNQMRPIGAVPAEQPSYPTSLLYCPQCELVQLGLTVDPEIIFPPSYPYTSGTTRILRDNFAALYKQTHELLQLMPQDLIVDIGSNDGTLLSNFKNGGHRVLGIEPTDTAKIAESRGIPTLNRYFGAESAAEAVRKDGKARIITAANCFAHIEDVHAIIDAVLELLDARGVFITESHYLIGLLNSVQYDTIYHEHLRYYSLHSLKYLLEMHDLEVFHAVPIPTHGGSIRIYAARKGDYPINQSVATMLASEPTGDAMRKRLSQFRHDVLMTKLGLHALIRDIKQQRKRICGVSAPSRASTLVNNVGLDDSILDYVCEIKGSLKIGKYMPGTVIPVVDEARMFDEQPEYALILSWHIADELMPKLRERGYRGQFIVPLPEPRIVSA
jgi:C-methyltransferase C-terminal domain/Putative zinc binding domain/Methyltransferase domain